MRKMSLLLGAALAAWSSGAAPLNVEVPPIALRGYGTVSYQGKGDGKVSLGVFRCESPEKAKIVASKYFADLQNYGAVKKIAPATLEIRHGGLWFVGLDGANVMVLTAPDAAALEAGKVKHSAAKWVPATENAYPRYLDNFDNAALAIWWMSTTKSAEEMKWFTENPVVANLHYQDMGLMLAPNVFDNAGPRNAAAQLRTAGKPYRTMMWTGNGKQAWYSWSNMPGEVQEQLVEGFTGENYHRAAGYYANHVATPLLNDLQLNAMYKLMDNWKDDPDLMSWMEPHGEINFRIMLRPPNSNVRFPEYLRTIRRYDLAGLNKAWGEKFARIEEAKIPDLSYFHGRRGTWIDLDDIDWKWIQGTLAEGESAGFAKTGFDDSGWFGAKRTDKRLLAFLQKDVYDPEKSTQKPDSLWTRFSHEVPAEFLKQKKIYLHIMPQAPKNNRNLAVWINGQEVARELVDARTRASNEHSEVEVSRFLKPGKNEFVIHSEGGRIAYRVFLSPLAAGKFPYADSGLNQRFIDWRDFLRHEKFQSLELYLKAMRSVDPVRPIKVMTPHQWQSDAFDLFEEYGAFPQLTGETTWYRPMHYKGYTQLRNRYSTSEPAGPQNNPITGQHMYANVFFESQDGHDYGFDFSRDFWKFPKVVKWWTDNAALLRTVGKTDLQRTDLGLLRDLNQDARYATSMIWDWDMSRGSFPALGLVPVLVDGPDLEKGLADGKVKVMFDCATTVMDEKLLAAVKRYVEQGGIFVAQHHTGQHTPRDRDAWPLPKAFGLKVDGKGASGDIIFSKDQTLFPSLRGQTRGGYGASIDSTGVERSGQVTIRGKANAIATWADGSMAIAEVPFGKGRFIMLGAPFYMRFKDEAGKWLNDESRQAMVQELLNSLGIERETFVSDPRVWLERRASKNGVYDVYFATAMGMKAGKWTLDDRIQSELSMRRAAQAPVIDATTANAPDVPGMFTAGLLKLDKQSFSPYQVRQFAAVRENVGVEGPAFWLRQQEKGWYALKGKATIDRKKAEQTARDYAMKMGEDGLDISRDWDVESGTLKTAHMGSWREQGFPEGTTRVRYRKTVEVPAAWRDGKSRIYLAFGSHVSVGLNDQADIQLNGKPFASGLTYQFTLEIPEEQLKTGKLDIALDVTAKPKEGKTDGPTGTMYLHKLPKPSAAIDLAGDWTEIKSMLQNGGTIKVPGKRRIFGMTRSVEIPAEWKGKCVRLVIEEPLNAGRNSGKFRNLFLNHEGLLQESGFDGIGVRIDRFLQPGKVNTFDLFGYRLTSQPELFNSDVRAIRLEVY